MHTRLGVAFMTLATMLALAGCASPFLHGPSGTPASDPGLIGEWVVEGETVIRAAVSQSADAEGQYRVALTIHHKDELQSVLSLDLTLTGEEPPLYADLFLARSEREELVAAYGHLVMPVHQIMKVSRDGDTLRAWPFDEGWLQREGGVAPSEPLAVGGRVVTVVTAAPDDVRRLLEKSRNDADAFGDPFVFHRIRPAP